VVVVTVLALWFRRPWVDELVEVGVEEVEEGDVPRWLGGAS